MIVEFTPEQKEFILKKWLPALRSGKYMKGNGYMRRGFDTYMKWCCLGVVSDLCDVEWFRDGSYQDKDMWIYQDDDGKASLALGKTVREKTGISAIGMFTPMYKGYGSLSGLNDHSGMSFDEIADFIEDIVLERSEYRFERVS